MKFDTKFDNKKNIVYVNIEGDLNSRESTEDLASISKFGKDNNCKKFLFDLTNAVLKDTKLDSLNFAINLDNYGFESTDKGALVYSRDQDADVYKFGEKVNADREWNNMKYFKSFEEAEKWLNE